MNKIVAVLLSQILFVAQSFADTMTWCGLDNWNPWIYPSGDSYAGILIDQLEVFKKNNPSIQVQARVIKNWKRCQAEVENGNVSMILGAYKTPEREVIFDYLKEPSFINQSNLGVYAAEDNDKMNNIDTLDDLRSYRLGILKGDSYGKTVDVFIKSLSGREITEVNSKGQTLKMVSAKRLDYFFLPEGTLDLTIAENIKLFPELANVKFKKVFEVTQLIPAFNVFGKNIENYAKYSDLWLAAIQEYYNTVDIDAEIAKHKNVK
ncbi:transporter substrate-binding domain-containing protein [Vibrio coralliilyticus]|uniref:transporter substrate-binding domain-containing protein n=1 Tax=Vibrio coralliilyticus TaxID=190893 RepID=UPI0017DAB1E7|nr:transporter substrate-binding domain-containing protein [Vibrio coralliilyticus]NUW67095.1 transporter substrate-binding domain-containing protein [Vibrio coralliilyticus]